MKTCKKTIFGGMLLAALAFPVSAFADTIVWKDPVHGFTMSYPDTWTVQTEDTPSTRLRVAGSLGEDLATCRMKAIEDGRVKIYPKHLVDKAVAHALDLEFWKGEAAQYEDAQVSNFFAPASLGDKGDATAVYVNYVSSDGTKKIAMTGVMIGSIYGDKRFLASCASKAEAYDRWAPVFMSILDSVQLDNRYHPFATGYYRDFLMDPILVLPRTKPGTVDPTKNDFMPSLFVDKYHR